MWRKINFELRFEFRVFFPLRLRLVNIVCTNFLTLLEGRKDGFIPFGSSLAQRKRRIWTQEADTIFVDFNCYAWRLWFTDVLILVRCANKINYAKGRTTDTWRSFGLNNQCMMTLTLNQYCREGNYLKTKYTAEIISNWWAVTLICSGSLLKWMRGELKQIDKRTRKHMTMYKALHPSDDVGRHVKIVRRLARIQDGEGTSIQNLGDYIKNAEEDLLHRLETI